MGKSSEWISGQMFEDGRDSEILFSHTVLNMLERFEICLKALGF